MALTQYNPGDIETKWYQKWQESGFFKPNMKTDVPAFSIQLPPPNVTGVLHMGHAFNQTVMDSLTRYHRMLGDNTCWIPGFDHSGIATQIVVERSLAQEGVTRAQLGRESFLAKVWEWKDRSGGTMKEQMCRLGCSVDWGREYFTLDERLSRVVREVFVRLYEDGLIYRGKRLVNWDPKLGTAVSDLEVENVEEEGSMWEIKYPLKDDPKQFLVVATTRPETLLGDVALAVNPKDERYQDVIGKEVLLPLSERALPVIADDYVDAEFGTGVVKITPAHDFNDYEVGKRHTTPLINILSLEGKILESAEVFSYTNPKLKEFFPLPAAYQGLEAHSARKKILADLEKAGYLVATKKHRLTVPRGDRTGTVIEPMLTDQWFVSLKEKPKGGGKPSLADLARDAVTGEDAIRFIPANWINTYNQWLAEPQDWCISRQLWWGHQIPAWYDEEGKVYVAKSEAEAQKLAGDKKIVQDEDVLDTWFSSALVPFSTLGWPEATPDLAAFLPSSVLVTGHEIIFFWVARMIMLTRYFTDSIPFRDVYIHGIVRDHEGRKMSKSEGNVIDPVDVIDGVDLDTLVKKRTTGLRRPEKAEAIARDTKKLFPEGMESYGADALRLTMASYASLGRSINFDLKRCAGYRNFCNKLWQVTRFVTLNVTPEEPLPAKPKTPLTFVDEWMLSRLEEVKEEVQEAFTTYRLDLVVQGLYEFVWNEYCDWFVELAKVELKSDEQKEGAKWVLVHVLEEILRLLHPVMPFITEELWQVIAPLAGTKTTPSIMLAPWPEVRPELIDENAVKKTRDLQELITEIRNLKTKMDLSPGLKPPLILSGETSVLKAYLPYLPLLARVGDVTLEKTLPESADVPVGVTPIAKFMLKVEVDLTASRARLLRELEKNQKTEMKLEAKLAQPGYRQKAPPALVEKDLAELAKRRAVSKQLKAELAALPPA